MDRVGFEGAAIKSFWNPTLAFQYPLVDRVGFEGAQLGQRLVLVRKFQYPLVDRVGFEGLESLCPGSSSLCFSILWWIELVLRGQAAARPARFQRVFQYPLVDRVGFEGRKKERISTPDGTRFSILWWIELVLRAT